MSGGVDSSVAAALLVEQGYDVTGVYMKNWSQDLPGMKCPWAEDLADAKRVAVGLGIDFQVFDFEREYRDKVVQYMIDEYQAGRTPNPDIMCNQEVKFRLFLDAALDAGADMIATGHYAQVIHGGIPANEHNQPNFLGHVSPADAGDVGNTLKNSSGHAHLLRAKDENKDQTYFLYRASNEALQKTLFPLGNFTKPEIRDMAKTRNLWTASKKESMGVCFVGSVGMREFLSQYVATQPGAIVERETGAQVGEHDGAIFYTLGQRHGLDIGGGLPYYIVGKDMAKNEVYVSRNLDSSEIWRQEITLENIHWINEPRANQPLQVRVRHRAPLIHAQLNDNKLTLSESQRAVTPGQSVVIYSGEECLGGGIVVN